MEQPEPLRIAPRRRRPPRRLTVAPALLAGITLAAGSIGIRASEAPPAPGRIDAYLKVRAEAEEATGTPEGPERIRKCEQFLKAHPDYPNRTEIIWPIVNDSVKTSGFDPNRISDLLEELVTTKVGDEAAADASWVVPEYHLRHNFSLDRAERLIRLSRERLERDRQKLRARPESDQRRDKLAELDYRESGLNMAEARLRLARGDAAGALEILDRHWPPSDSGMVMRSRKDGALRNLPTDRNDWLDLTRAGAYARLGNRARAREYLDRVLLLEEAEPDLKATVDRLRADLGVPPPAPLEFRADPRPAPEMKLKDLAGKTAQLADFRGRVALLMFWTTW